MDETDRQSFSSRQAAEAAGITYRQLDYWARTEVLGPSLRSATGSGSRRRYSLADVRIMRTICVLSDLGIQVGQLHRLVAELRLVRSWEGPLWVTPAGEAGRDLDRLGPAAVLYRLDLALLASSVSAAEPRLAAVR